MVYAFFLDDLAGATNGFHDDNLLSCKNERSVYKGVVRDKTVAIKVLKTQHKKKEPQVSHGGRRRSSSFSTEVPTELSIIGSIEHFHLVPVIGYTVSWESTYIVYEFMSQGSLRQRRENEGALPWKVGLKIACEVAEAISFLHSLDPPIVHRDLKSSNILLDGEGRAHVSDFGFSSVFMKKEIDIVVGTEGYVCPHYLATGIYSEAVDVYSYGVVLLEIMTGLPAVFRDGTKLASEIRGDLVKSKRQVSDWPARMFDKLLEIVGLCLTPDPARRPTMQEVQLAVEKFEVMSTRIKPTAHCNETPSTQTQQDSGRQCPPPPPSHFGATPFPPPPPSHFGATPLTLPADASQGGQAQQRQQQLQNSAHEGAGVGCVASGDIDVGRASEALDQLEDDTVVDLLDAVAIEETGRCVEASFDAGSGTIDINPVPTGQSNEAHRSEAVGGAQIPDDSGSVPSEVETTKKKFFSKLKSRIGKRINSLRRKSRKEADDHDSPREEASGLVIQDHPDPNKTSMCVICLTSPRTVLLSCGHHVLCFACAGLVMKQKQTCPMCRRRVDISEITASQYDESFVLNDHVKKELKLKAMKARARKRCTRCGNHFTQRSNHDTACRYHIGDLKLDRHWMVKWWSCCEQPETSNGCHVGEHLGDRLLKSTDVADIDPHTQDRLLRPVAQPLPLSAR